MNTKYDDNTFDVVYFCESICHNDFDNVIKEAYRILKPNGILYIKDLVIKSSKNKLNKEELNNLNHFINSWGYNVFDIETIINKIDSIGGFKLINKKKFIKPSLNWFDAVRNSSLKKYHNAKLSNIPPIRGADFLYRKYK
jgi:ubiquinone/menaquinone biosynthesis C-methylase UbiE